MSVALSAAFVAIPRASAWPQDQEYPRFETFLGYNYVRFNPNVDLIPNFGANGGSGQFVYNFNRWIGFAADVGAVHKGTLAGLNLDTTVMNFVAGPRFTFRKHGRFVPFAQALFGGGYATTSTEVFVFPSGQAIIPPGFTGSPFTETSARVQASSTHFAMLAGLGLDIKINRHISFRPVEADYYLTRMPSLLTSGNNNRNNFRYAAGVNFLFGYPK
jgi:hypothetical protein